MIPNTVTGGKIEIINITICIRATHTQTKQSNLLNFTDIKIAVKAQALVSQLTKLFP